LGAFCACTTVTILKFYSNFTCQKFLSFRYVFGFKICQDVHDYLLKVDGVDDVKVNVSNHFMAEQINNQVNNSPNPKKQG